LTLYGRERRARLRLEKRAPELLSVAREAKAKYGRSCRASARGRNRRNAAGTLISATMHADAHVMVRAPGWNR